MTGGLLRWVTAGIEHLHQTGVISRGHQNKDITGGNPPAKRTTHLSETTAGGGLRLRRDIGGLRSGNTLNTVGGALLGRSTPDRGRHHRKEVRGLRVQNIQRSAKGTLRRRTTGGDLREEIKALRVERKTTTPGETRQGRIRR